MKKLTAETEFPRQWTEKEHGVDIITQPYITGLYMAGNKAGRNVFQTTILWSNLPKLMKKVKNIEGITISKIGDFLKESELELLNS